MPNIKSISSFFSFKKCFLLWFCLCFSLYFILLPYQSSKPLSIGLFNKNNQIKNNNITINILNKSTIKNDFLYINLLESSFKNYIKHIGPIKKWKSNEYIQDHGALRIRIINNTLYVRKLIYNRLRGNHKDFLTYIFLFLEY